MSQRSFTIKDLALTVPLVFVVAFFVLGFVRDSRESANRIKCGSNLRQIGQAMRQYALDHGGEFPRTQFGPLEPGPQFFTGVAAKEPAAENGVSANT